MANLETQDWKHDVQLNIPKDQKGFKLISLLLQDQMKNWKNLNIYKYIYILCKSTTKPPLQLPCAILSFPSTDFFQPQPGRGATTAGKYSNIFQWMLKWKVTDTRRIHKISKMFKDWKRRIKKVGLSDLYNLMFQMLSLQSAGMVSDMLVFFPRASPQHFAAGCLCSGRKHGISTVWGKFVHGTRHTAIWYYFPSYQAWHLHLALEPDGASQAFLKLKSDLAQGAFPNTARGDCKSPGWT